MAKKVKRRNPWVRGIVFTLVAVLLVGVGVVGAYLFELNSSFSQAETLDNPFPDNRMPSVDGTQNILLLGSDTRGELGDDIDDMTGQRADTIMVAHIPKDRETIQVMSIMRDNWVELPDGRESKINAALAYGGMPMMVETVESLIGVKIDHVAIIDFEGFKGLTDALDGVTVNNPQAFSDRGHDFAAADITLNGEEALTFVRARYPFSDGDYTRVQNQQRYLKALMNTFLSRETLTNPKRIAESVDAISPYLIVDSGLDGGYMLSEGFSLRSIRGEDVRFFTSPTLGTGTSFDGQSIVRPDWAGWEQLQNHFKNGSVADWSPEG